MVDFMNGSGGYANGFGVQPSVLGDSLRREFPEVTRDFSGLARAIESSSRGLDPFRELNRALVREYVGPSYGETRGKRKYLNKLRQAVDAYTMLLAANNPRIEITTPYDQLRPFANQFSVAINNHCKEISLKDTIRNWVLDAFFCIGIVKVHLKESYEVEIENDLWMDPGKVFASNVSIDNFCYDMGVSRPSAWRWAADAYRIPQSAIERGVEIGMYDPVAAAAIKPTSKFYQSGDRLDEFSSGYAVDRDEFEPMVDLCDVWIKSERKVYTFAMTDRASFRIAEKPLAVMDWMEPDHGPYHILGFADVPENAMPASPAADLDEMDRLLNNLWRKLARQAMRQKDIVVIRSDGVDTGKKFQRESDGGIITGDPTAIGVARNPGADNNNQAFSEMVKTNLDIQAGNITALLGLGAQAETLGQEQIIRDAGNRKIGQMQYRVIEATTALVRSIGYQLWYDDVNTIAGEIDIPGTDYKVPAELASWRPGDREGNFIDYNFDINIYSMTYRPPAMQAETVTSLLTNIFIPMQQLLMQQGGSIDFAELTKRYASLMGVEWLKDIVTFTNPLSPDQLPDDGTAGPAITNRTYTRRNIPTGGTEQARSNVLQQAMRGQEPTPQQVNSMQYPPAQ